MHNIKKKKKREKRNMKKCCIRKTKVYEYMCMYVFNSLKSHDDKQVDVAWLDFSLVLHYIVDTLYDPLTRFLSP